MTVQELIEKLQAFPGDAEISVEDDDHYASRIIAIESVGKFVILITEGE